MALHITADPAQVEMLLDAALRHDPLLNTVFSSVSRGLAAPDAAPWAAHPTGNPLVLAARSQRRTPVSLTAGWSGRAADALSQALHGLDPPAAVVMGPAESVQAIGMPAPVVARRAERLFRLQRLVPPIDVAGRPRLADEDDLAAVAEWFRAFRLESIGHLPPGYDAATELAQRRPVTRIWLWQSIEGAPVSMALAQPTARGVARIGPIYTPEAHRGQGFGSAVTAAATTDILTRPAVACLFTDLANPTSNKIYEAIGYRAVADFTELRLQ